MQQPRNTPTPASRPGLSRRSALKLLLGAGAALALKSPGVASAGAAQLERVIPRARETLPAVGLGTARVFDVGTSAKARAPLKEVLRSFVALGGSTIDTSPMYGNAETVIGDLTAQLGVRPSLFLATKVWTRGRESGIRQMERSMQRLRTDRIELMQVHNLVDWRTQLDTLRQWKSAGRIRYLGVTHYRVDAFDDLEHLIKTESLDFVQLNYSIATREAEQRLLPLSRDAGTAVLVNRPFEAGFLFRAVRGKPVPSWAAEFDCQSWGQFFLKYVLSEPAVTCVIPATSKPQHLADNMGAGRGRLPSARMRKRMWQYLEQL